MATSSTEQVAMASKLKKPVVDLEGVLRCPGTHLLLGRLAFLMDCLYLATNAMATASA